MDAGRCVEAAAADAIAEAVTADAAVVGPVDMRDEKEAAVAVVDTFRRGGLAGTVAVRDDFAGFIDAALHLLRPAAG